MIRSLLVYFLTLFALHGAAANHSLYWWRPSQDLQTNFGDELSHVIVERITNQSIPRCNLEMPDHTLLAAGSILHFARNDDLIWGSGCRTDGFLDVTALDVRAVRGPKTRAMLLVRGVDCPEVYGDPAILMSDLFPEFSGQEPTTDYIIIPNIGEIPAFASYKNVVLPTEPWQEIVDKINKSRLVISSSLHGLIVAESYGIPARYLKMTWMEPLFKYQDYYESTGRPNFRYATSVQEALDMGGEPPGFIDRQPLLDAFPWDHFQGD